MHTLLPVTLHTCVFQQSHLEKGCIYHTQPKCVTLNILLPVGKHALPENVIQGIEHWFN